MQSIDNKMKEEIPEARSSFSTDQQEFGSCCFGRDPVHYSRQEQVNRGTFVDSSQQLAHEEVAVDEGIMYCILCSKRFRCKKAFHDHISIAHSKAYTSATSELCTETQNYINYYDLIPIVKSEVDENLIKVEREDISTPGLSTFTGLNSTHNEQITVKSEDHPQPMRKSFVNDYEDEQYAIENAVKEEKCISAMNTFRADEPGPVPLVQTKKAFPDKKTRTKSNPDEHNEEPSLGIRHANLNVNQVKKVKRCNRKLDQEQFACSFCDYKCNKSNYLKRHIRKHTVEKPVACNICDYKCSDNGYLRYHIRTHTGEKPFTCDICGYKCSTKSNLKKHIITHTGKKPFACSMCDYKFSRTSSLKIHIRTHTGEKPFLCAMCDYKCSVKGNLTKHMKTHSKDKPFACDMCDYKCRNKHNLRNHIRIHTGEKPFACVMCDHKYSVKSSLIYHIKTHTGEKRFACNMCDYKCISKLSFTIHTRTHTGEKPFACNMCDYKCSVKSSLTYHIKMHTGEKSFACIMCSYRCSDNSSLRNHVRTHTGEKQFACNMCGYKCISKSSLKKHIITHTGEK